MRTLNPMTPDTQFTSLLEHMPMGVYVIDADFRIAHVNPAAAPVFKAVPGGVIGRDFSEVIHSIRERAYADETVRIFRRTLATGDSYAKTETATMPGRPLGGFYEWRVERIVMDNDRHGLACFFKDISREMHSQLLDRFRVALSDALRPLMNPDEIPTVAAKLLGERLGVNSVVYAEMESRPDSDYFVARQLYRAGDAPDYTGEYRVNDYGRELFSEMRSGRTLVVNDIANEDRLGAEEKRAYTALGVNAYIKVPLVKEGRQVSLISVHQAGLRYWSPLEVALVEETAERTWAAAERARAEARMREGQLDSARQRRLYEAILNNTPDFAYIWDAQHRFVYANENLRKMYGKTAEEIVGKGFLDMGYEPWHAEMHEREIDQVIATRQPIRGEVPFNGTYGRRIYDYIFVPVLGPNGEVEAVAGTTRDVTDIKESERRKDEFLATLAHELRNPLAPIRNAVQVLVMTNDTPQVRQICDMMERQVGHMVRLVDDLMEISRISRGIIELRCERTTLESVVRSAVDTSTPLINAANHQLSVEMPAEPVVLYGDPIRLAQVIANLLNNAAKYTNRGGRIWLSAEQDDKEIVIRVRDNGIGIAADALPQIFDMFMQVKNASTHTHGGLGIGLSLARQLVEMHGGSVLATSAGPGKGSEFTVRLPRVTSPAGATATPAVGGTGLVKKRVLIVDDNEDAASTLAMLVARLGAEVQVANDGFTALSLMASFHPEIALLDLGMPVMNGFEVAKRARQVPGLDKLKLVALTGWGQPEDRERTRTAGFDHHLVKPAAFPELQKLLESLD
jgi:PAS domain S-box-containing protein